MCIDIKWTEPKSIRFLRKKFIRNKKILDYFIENLKLAFIITIVFFIIGYLHGHFQIYVLISYCLIIGIVLISIVSLCAYFTFNTMRLRIDMTDHSIIAHMINGEEVEFPFNMIKEIEIKKGIYKGTQYRVLIIQTKEKDAIFLSNDVNIDYLINIFERKNVEVIQS